MFVHADQKPGISALTQLQLEAWGHAYDVLGRSVLIKCLWTVGKGHPVVSLTGFELVSVIVRRL